MTRTIYDFNKNDYEDQLPRKGDKITSRQDRRPIWYSLMLLFAALLVALQVMDSTRQILFGPNQWQLLCIVILAILAAPLVDIKNVWAHGIWQVYKQFYRGVYTSWKEMLWPRIASMASFFAAGAFLFVRVGGKYLPLSDAIKIFLPSLFLTLLVDTLNGPAFVVHALDLQHHHCSLCAFVSWLPFQGFLAGLSALPDGGPPVRLVLGLSWFFLWLITHLLVISFIALVITVAGMFVIAFTIAKAIEPDVVRQSSFVHMTDLHVTPAGEESFEKGARKNADVLRDVHLQIAAADRPILITGDVTDSGSRLEWLNFLGTVKAARQQGEKNSFIILAPGNHDIFPYTKSFRPLRSSLPFESRLPRLRKIRYLAAVLEVCPAMKVLIEGQEELLSAVLHKHQAIIDETVDPTKNNVDVLQIDRLWDSCFPMSCVTDSALYVVLDTNRPHSNFWTSAFGRVNDAQRNRLESILERYGKRENASVVVLGHHHLYVPKQTICQDWRLKHLEMVDGRSLGKILSNSADYYVHGHRHFEYRFKMGKMSVLSGLSTKFP